MEEFILRRLFFSFETIEVFVGTRKYPTKYGSGKIE